VLGERALGASASRKFACETDARGALAEQTERLPAYYFEVEASLTATPRYAERGRPKKGQVPSATKVWRIEGTFSVAEERAEREWHRRACYISS
jgi:hypothetical protein